MAEMQTQKAAAQVLADGETKTCSGCKGEIAGGEHYISIDEKNIFHSEHFNCAKCSSGLADKPYLSKDGKYYDEACYVEEFHPKCGGCQKGIEGKYMTALGQPWHPEHFVCTKCKTAFADEKYHSMKNMPYCDNCYHADFGDKCGKCGEAIKENKFEAMGQLWHSTCFVCAQGDHSLDGDMSYHNHNGLIYCPAHYKEVAYNKCKGCSKLIEEQFFTDANKDTWHGACLKCTTCGGKAALQGATGNFYCEPCSKKATAPAAAK